MYSAEREGAQLVARVPAIDGYIGTRHWSQIVPLVEEGWLDGDVTHRVAVEYLDPLRQNGVDTVVLGCTHYPLLKPVLQRVLGQEVRLIDSAEETAKSLRKRLSEDGTASGAGGPADIRFFVSDIPHHFRRVGEMCLGRPIENVVQVDLDSMHLDGPDG